MLTVVVPPALAERVRELLATLPAHRTQVRLRAVADPEHAEDADLVVTAQGVALAWDWLDRRPPWLLPTLPLSATSLGALLSLAGGDEAAAVALVPALGPDLAALAAIADGDAPAGPLPDGRTPRERHNLGVRLHYAPDADPERALTAYTDALLDAPTPCAYAFTARQAATLLVDTGRTGEALALLQAVPTGDLPVVARESIDALRCSAQLEALDPLTPPEVADRLARELDDARAAQDRRGNTLRAALLRLDVSRVLQQLGRFAEGVETVQAAREAFAEAGSPELVATADLRRGELLHAWAQAGDAAQYKHALEAFQRALAVFTKDVAPTLFASVHHELAILYAEMPGEAHQRPLMLALSGTSFQEALSVYTAEAAPEVHSRIRANYGNALLRCPESHLRDPVERAVEQFRLSLAVAGPGQPPLERGITLLNLLEALTQLGWAAGDAAAERRRRDELDEVLIALEALALPAGLAEEVARRRAQLALVLAEPEPVA